MHVNTYVKVGILIYSAWEADSAEFVPNLRSEDNSTRIHLFCAQFNTFFNNCDR